MTDPQWRPMIRTDLEVVAVGDECVIWDQLRNRVHRLDPVAAVLWPFLDGSASLAELAGDVADVWDMPATEATEALKVLVGQLHEAGLLVDDSSAEPSVEPAGSGPRYLTDPPVP